MLTWPSPPVMCARTARGHRKTHGAASAARVLPALWSAVGAFTACSGVAIVVWHVDAGADCSPALLTSMAGRQCWHHKRVRPALLRSAEDRQFALRRPIRAMLSVAEAWPALQRRSRRWWHHEGAISAVMHGKEEPAPWRCGQRGG
jgi:hypothetical protein